MPGWDGSCPYGTYPDGSGLCCAGVCDSFAPASSPDPAVSFMPLPDSDPCDIGCTVNPDTNSCNSPILIDVAGDGFHLTDAARGVSFDINGDGVTE